jgi:arginase
LSVEDIRSRPDAIDEQMRRLSRMTDVIYIHVDMDVLDPAEVSGHPLTAPEGPTSVELAAAIRRIFANPKAAALGIASIPFGARDKGGLSLRAAYRLIEASVAGAKSR